MMAHPHEAVGSVRDSLKSPASALEPIRRCILTGRRDARSALIRLALAPDGLLLPDLAAKAPGRGVWIGADGAVLAKALAKGKLMALAARALKLKPAGLLVPPDLLARLETGLTRRFLDRLGLANRAGACLFGADRIADAVRSGSLQGLLHAADAADDGVQKLAGTLHSAAARGKGAWRLRLPLGRDEMSLALGREHVVHVGLTDFASACRLAIDARRLCAFLNTKDALQTAA